MIPWGVQFLRRKRQDRGSIAAADEGDDFDLVARGEGIVQPLGANEAPIAFDGDFFHRKGKLLNELPEGGAVG